MIFHFYKKREKFSDYFKPRKKIIIGYRKTLGTIVGIRGFKTRVRANEELVEKGETKRIIELLSESARERGSGVPFALSKNLERKLSDYKIKVAGLSTSIPLFYRECEKAGIRIEGNKYIIID